MSPTLGITIHRGTHSIGGSCVEISCDGSRVILDLGLPLMGRDGADLEKHILDNPTLSNGILLGVDGLYSFQAPDVAAVLLSHAHLDHSGLLNWVHPEIPIYMSNESKRLIETGNIFYKPEMQLNNVPSHTRTFEHWQPFTIGPFTITPHMIDHSGFGADCFEIEAGGKKIFYSGDISGHGRKAKVFDRLVKEPPENVDCLLLEGTTLGGQHNDSLPAEKDVEHEMHRIFNDQKDITFVMSAGSNIDRTVSIYKAAKHARKTLVVDLYQYYLLKELKLTAGGLPPHNDDHLRVFFPKTQAEKLVDKFTIQKLYGWKPRHLKRDEIVRGRENMIVSYSLYEMERLAKELIKDGPLDQSTFIYSMWQGYLARDPSFQNFASQYNLKTQNLHSSGHAYLKELQQLATALNPKTTIPIHTLSGNTFHTHFKNIKRLDDGDVFEL